MMISSKEELEHRRWNRIGGCLFVLLVLLSASTAISTAVAVPQDVTLTLTATIPEGYTAGNYLLNVTASAPITGPVTLHWTINDEGAFTNTTQMTNGFFERTFGCPNPGNWTIWLVWNGNDQYASSQSNSVTVSGNPAGPQFEGSDSDPTIYLAIALVVVIVVIVLAFAYFRIKKKA